MLHDTHFINKEEKYIRSIRGYDSYFSNFNSRSGGVAIFINNNCDCKVNNIEKGDEDNLLILAAKYVIKLSFYYIFMDQLKITTFLSDDFRDNVTLQ
jgi:hypothetical protein